MSNIEQQYIDLYRQAGEMLRRNSSPVMNALRDDAMKAFAAAGFPVTKNEKYKYTDIPSCFAPDYGLNLNRLEVKTNPYDVFKCDVPNISTLQIFTVNDCFYSDGRQNAALPEGVMIGSLRELSEKHPELVERYYGKAADVNADALIAFNTAFVQDGVMVYIPDGVVLEKPLQLVNIRHSDVVDTMVNRRLLVVLGRGAQARMLICDHAEGEHKFLSTQVAEVFVGEGAVLDYYEIEETGSSNIRVANTYVRQMANSNVLFNGVTLTNGITRNMVNVSLEGEGAEVMLNGLATVDKKQHIDNNTFIDHRVPHCQSKELFKYVLDDAATGAFAGKVLVRHGAQKTVSEQVDKNLCLTKDARMYTQPQLEIYADDVKCSHGATVGQLDEDAVFYMRQRGLSLKEARMLLMFAFVNEVVDTIKLDPLKERLHRLVELRFRGELSKCTGCNVCKK